MTLIQKTGVFFATKRGELRAFFKRAKDVYEKIRFYDRLEKAQIDRRAKCPGCGHGGPRGYWPLRHYERGVVDHEIRFSEEHQAILHECPTCKATWGEKCIVKPADWKVGRVDEEAPSDVVETTRTIAEG